jgi:hypothetical protein
MNTYIYIYIYIFGCIYIDTHCGWAFCEENKVLHASTGLGQFAVKNCGLDTINGCANARDLYELSAKNSGTYVYIYIYIYLYIYIIYICIYVYTHFIYMCIYTFIYIHGYIYINRYNSSSKIYGADFMG